MDSFHLFAALYAWNHSAAWSVAAMLGVAAFNPRAFFGTMAALSLGYLIVCQFT